MKKIFVLLFAMAAGEVCAVQRADFQGFVSRDATVAIHVSENTDMHWGGITDSASRPDPYVPILQGPRGWKYWHIYGFLMEQLRSDGTPFDVIFDDEISQGGLFVSQLDISADIAAGRVQRRKGELKYAVVFSSSNICSSDAVVAALDGFVIGGGRAVVGGASFIKAGDCSERVVPPFSIVPNQAHRVIASAKSSFSSEYAPNATIDSTGQNLWLNGIADVLPTWIMYRFETGSVAMPTVAQVALQQSHYQDRGYGYSYLIKDFDVQISTNENCAEETFITVASDVGSQLSGAYQVLSFPARQARCIRVKATSSHETMPYPGYSTWNWVGLSSFQAFDSAGNSLIRDTYVAGNIWRAMGLSPVRIDGCFDHFKRVDAESREPLLHHFAEDDETRGYRLGTSQSSSGYMQLHHWGQQTTLDPSSSDGPARVLAIDEPASEPGAAAECEQGSSKPVLATKQRGRGRYIYSASINSLAGWSMHSSVAYVYGFYRNAIDEAYRSRGVPIARIGSWPWPYKAAFMTRHDHFSHRGFDPLSVADDDLVARIERYRDGLTGGTTLRDFPVKGSYFLLNEWSAGGERIALPMGAAPCILSPANDCDAQVASSVRDLVQLGAEIGTHSYLPGSEITEFSGERERLNAYLGVHSSPAIYVSHGAYSHFDQDDPGLVGINTMVQAGVVSKGEDGYGAHPHYALKLSDPTVSIYNDLARHSVVEIPATGLMTRPGLGQWPPMYGQISHEISSNPQACNQDSIPVRPCMERAANLMHGLGGVINLYDYIGDHSSGFSNDGNPDAQEFDAYIRYAQKLPYVYTTSTRDIAAWWNDRAEIRVTTSHMAPSEYRIDLTGSSSYPVSVNVDIPQAALLQSVHVNGVPRSQCEYLANGDELKAWLSSNTHMQCYVREGDSFRIGAIAPAIVSLAW